MRRLEGAGAQKETTKNKAKAGVVTAYLVPFMNRGRVYTLEPASDSTNIVLNMP
jgi:hypothetical protein